MADEMIKARRQLRPGYAWEFRGKNDKALNRRICRKRLKAQDRRGQE